MEPFADQEGVEPSSPQPCDIFPRFDTALGNLRHPGRHARCQLQRGVEIDLERMQVAIVDPDQVEAGIEGAPKFFLLVNFAQHIQLPMEGMQT